MKFENIKDLIELVGCVIIIGAKGKTPLYVSSVAIKKENLSVFYADITLEVVRPIKQNNNKYRLAKPYVYNDLVRRMIITDNTLNDDLKKIKIYLKKDDINCISFDDDIWSLKGE